jgi:cysteine desulfurase/selenocysteine lyase
MPDSLLKPTPRFSRSLEDIRADFPILHKPLVDARGRERKLIYLDNGASTQKPQAVIDAITHYYSSTNANVHRAIHTLGEEATRLYEESRAKIVKFIGAANYKEIIFTKGTTESLNLLAYCLRGHLKPGDTILMSEMEHHSDLVPWQMAAEATGAQLKYIPVDDQGLLDLDFLESLEGQKVKILAVTHMSNVLGTVNPVKELAAWAKKVGAISIIDGAQSVPHMPVNVQDLGVDFLAFGGHKMVGPTGIGILYGREELLLEIPPFHGGGEMIESVFWDHFTPNELPYKFEAGTPNMAGAIGLGAAVDYLTELGMDNIAHWEHEITAYAHKRFKEIPGGRIFGEAPGKGGMMSFAIGKIHSHDLASFLDHKGIAVRAGHHCAHPLVRKFGVSSTTRASFYFYNTMEEVDALIDALQRSGGVFLLVFFHFDRLYTLKQFPFIVLKSLCFCPGYNLGKYWSVSRMVWM